MQRRLYSQSLTKSFERTVLMLSCTVICLAPLFPIENTLFEAGVVLIAGLLAWLLVIGNFRSYILKLNRLPLILLAIYVLSLIVSVIAHCSPIDLMGDRLNHLGALPLLAIVGCGIGLSQVDKRKLLESLYVSIVVLAVSSIVYSSAVDHMFFRLPGTIQQTDILSIITGCGFFIGRFLLATGKVMGRRTLLLAGQCTLLGLILLSETRVTIIICGTLWLLFVLTDKGFRWQSVKTGITALTVIILVGASVALGTRLTNTAYGYESMAYRAHLQEAGLRAATRKPLGYGLGGLRQALRCQDLTARDLKLTCSQGISFDSSHDIYLDRVLGLGVIGGLAFTGFVIWCLSAGWRRFGFRDPLLICIGVIGVYYLTNVTDLVLELLFFILLVQACARGKEEAA